MGNSIKLGDIYYFEKGKKDRFISHTGYGKVIIAENCSSRGFAEVTSFDDREKVIIAKVKRCLYDYYDGISYKDFKDLLLERGYKLAFEQPFQRKYHMSGEGSKCTDEMRLVAYNKELNMIIVADSIYSMSTFNSVCCYCYGVNGNYLVRHRLFSHGNSNLAVFDLVHCNSYGVSRPLHIVEAYGSEDFSSKIKRCDVPSGWTYADSQGDVINSFDYFTDKFLNQCPKDLRDWFE